MYIVTTAQMQAAEKAANASGHSYQQMMELAGQAVARAIDQACEASGKRVLVLVGPGNNGGDGLVTARHLAQMGAQVVVYVWRRDTDSDRNWALLEGTPVEILRPEQAPTGLDPRLDSADVIVDALLGTGVSRPIEGTLAELLEQVKQQLAARRTLPSESLIDPTRPSPPGQAAPLVVAVDLPSGLNSDSGQVDPHTLPADLSVTFGAVKMGHILVPGAKVVGRLLVDDIGLTAEHFPANVALKLVTAADVAPLLPARPVSAHKGTFGTAVLVAGSVNFVGAALLAARAAARVGTGLVTVALPDPIYPIVAGQLAEATYLPLPAQAGAIAVEAVQPLLDNLTKAKALLLGPGLSQVGSVDQFCRALLAHPDVLPPVVLDADALNSLAGKAQWWEGVPPHCVLTPHPGEMARLTASDIEQVQTDRLEIARSMAAKWRQIILLKGAHTIIAGPDGRAVVMPFANPALAKAGSGDVLAGTIVGLMAQGLTPFDAAVAGAYLHGVAGELARDEVGVTAVIAGDLIRCLPGAIRAVTQKSGETNERRPTDKTIRS